MRCMKKRNGISHRRSELLRSLGSQRSADPPLSGPLIHPCLGLSGFNTLSLRLAGHSRRVEFRIAKKKKKYCRHSWVGLQKCRENGAVGVCRQGIKV